VQLGRLASGATASSNRAPDGHVDHEAARRQRRVALTGGGELGAPGGMASHSLQTRPRPNGSVHRVAKTKGAANQAPGKRAQPVRSAKAAKPAGRKRQASPAPHRASKPARPVPRRAGKPASAASRPRTKPVASAAEATGEPTAPAAHPMSEPAAPVAHAMDEPGSPPRDGEREAAPPAAPAPLPDGELIATRDIARLLRYGERFGTDKIDVRVLPLSLRAGSGALAVFDPGAPHTWQIFERPVGSGAFRVMLSVARPDDVAGGAAERLAAVVIHVGRPPVARWTVAQVRGEARPRPGEALPRTVTTSGWLVLIDAGDGCPGVIALPPATGVTPIEVPLTDGRRALALPCGNGGFTAYWAVDATDRPICVVIDFDVFTAKVWKAKPAAHAT